MLTLLLLFIPILTGIISLVAPHSMAKPLAMFSSLATLAVGIMALNAFVSHQEASLYVDTEWIAVIGAHFTLHIHSGMSMLMVLLTAIVFPLLTLATYQSSQDRAGVFYGLLLLAQAGLMGVFMAKDALLFYLFWELALIPVYFLSSMYGGERRVPVTFKFFVYTFVGSLLMLVALIILYNHTELKSFSYDAILQAGMSMSPTQQLGMFWLMFLAFAIKMPIFPFHTWQPDAYEQSATPVTVVLSALMVKMGLYAVVYWLMPILPAGVAHWTQLVMVLSVIGIIYASCMAMVQSNIKRLVAYSSIAHIGLMSAALFSGSALATEGVYIQMFNHGITILGIWILIHIIEQRLDTQSMTEMGGIAKVAPKFTIALVVLSLANIALPLTNGFPGEFMMFTGMFSSGIPMAKTLTIIAGVGVILAAVYTLSMVQKVAFGNTNQKTENFQDLNTLEFLSLIIIIAMVLVFGFQPNLLLNLLS